MIRVLLDASVLVDLLKRDPSRYQEARRLVILSSVGDYELWVCGMQLPTLVDEVSAGDLDAARACRQDLLELHRYLHFGLPNEAAITAALNSGWTFLDDAFVHQTAVLLGADVIVSDRDAELSRSTVPVMGVGGFFDWMERVQRISYADIKF
jgi:predicted nucleic acid-binding protein